MGSLGETLRQARLDRGATLADAEAETRIRRRYLEALEAEDYAALPAPVYTRGFIRTYARYLGLDPEATLDLYTPGRTREERAPIRPATPQLSSGRPLSLRLFVGLAAAVLIGLLLVYLWSQYNIFVESLNQADQVRTPTAVSTPVAAVPSPSGPTVLVSPTLATSPSPIPTPERGVVVEARVTERTWMEVWVDGTSRLQETLQSGAVRTFRGEQSVRMRVGNAGGVVVTVNGEQRGALGERNQVKDVVWER